MVQAQREFLLLDANGDGNISIDEFELFLHTIKDNLKMTNAEIKELVGKFDKNGDGIIDVKEFQSLITTGKKGNVIKNVLIHRYGIRDAFENYDRDGNGFITRDEFRKVVEDKYEAILGSEEIDKIMNRVDKNHDGKVDYEEFFKAFRYFPVHDFSAVFINR